MSKFMFQLERLRTKVEISGYLDMKMDARPLFYTYKAMYGIDEFINDSVN